MDEEILTIFIDESYKPLDNKMGRCVVCAVEVNNLEKINKEVSDYIVVIKQDDIRFGEISKLHFSGLNLLQRSGLIEFISKLDITAKIFVEYSIEPSQNAVKIRTIKNTIVSLEQIHKSKKINFFIEPTTEYKNSPIAKFCSDSYKSLAILPDSLIATFLDELSLDHENHLYKLVREKIRLQVYIVHGETIYSKRQDRI